jgi:hypothetical protein
MIWASVNLLFFIRISSFRIPRKFYFQSPLKNGGITASGVCLIPCKGVGKGACGEMKNPGVSAGVLHSPDGGGT